MYESLRFLHDRFFLNNPDPEEIPTLRRSLIVMLRTSRDLYLSLGATEESSAEEESSEEEGSEEMEEGSEEMEEGSEEMEE